MRTEYIAVTSPSQHKSLKRIKKDFRQFLINSFSVCDSRNRAYEIARAMVDLHSRTKQRDIPRSYSAIATNSHVQTVTRATNFIQSLGVFSVVRGYKKVNKYIFNHLDILQEFFGVSAWVELMYARLFTSKLNINNNIVSKCQENDRFSLNFKPEKGSEGTDICFSSKTGLYIPLELRPLNNTIEVSRADGAALVGVKYNHLFPDYEKQERLAAIRARDAAREARIRDEQVQYELNWKKKYGDTSKKLTVEAAMDMLFF